MTFYPSIAHFTPLHICVVVHHLLPPLESKLHEGRYFIFLHIIPVSGTQQSLKKYLISGRQERKWAGRQEGKGKGRKMIILAQGGRSSSVTVTARVTAGYPIWLPELFHLASACEAYLDVQPSNSQVPSPCRIYSLVCKPSPSSLQGDYFTILLKKSLPFYILYTISPSVQPLQKLLHELWALGDKVRILIDNIY